MIEFSRLAEAVPGVLGWGAEDGERSYVITFDNNFPDYGYRASWRVVGEKTQYLPDGYKSFAQAEAALVAIQQRKAN